MKTSEISGLPLAASWLSRSGEDGDVVVASRLRLARNLAERAYPHAASTEEREQIEREIVAAIREELTPEPFGADSFDIATAALSPSTRAFLCERSVLDEIVPARVILGGDERLAVLVDAVDHVRVAAIDAGRSLGACLERARTVDRALEHSLNFAVSMGWGYLSSEITNLGTAMRASVLAHLPALAMLGRLVAMSASMENSGYEIVPFLPGESFGSTTPSDPSTCAEVVGSSLYLLRNTRTLGSGEDAIVAKLEEYATKLIHYERVARDELCAARGEEIADSANRSLGILRFARSLSAVEARSLVSHLRLGRVAGLVSDVAMETVTTLLLVSQDSHIERSRSQDGEELDAARARVIRDLLVA